MTNEELIEEKIENEKLEDFRVDEFGFLDTPIWEIILPRDSQGYEHTDWCEAEDIKKAAQIMYERLPRTYKGSLDTQDLIPYISKQ